MLKTTSAGLVALAEVGNKDQDSKGIQVDRGEKELVQKSCKSQLKGQKTAKSKK